MKTLIAFFGALLVVALIIFVPYWVGTYVDNTQVFIGTWLLGFGFLTVICCGIFIFFAAFWVIRNQL